MGKTRRQRPARQDLPIVSQELKTISFDEMISDWERSSQQADQPVRLETDPVAHIISDWEKPQRYFEAITDARLWWLREMQLRSAALLKEITSRFLAIEACLTQLGVGQLGSKKLGVEKKTAKVVKKKSKVVKKAMKA